jgi:hypothetical protein
MKDSIYRVNIDPKLKNHLLNLCCFLGLMYLKDLATIGYDISYFKAGTTQMIDESIKLILAKLRP